jgi:hypothetical protein
MSKTPFLNFLKKISDRDYSNNFHKKVIAVFKQEGLNENHARILMSGDKRLYEAEVAKELSSLSGEERGFVAAGPQNHGPMYLWPSTVDKS